MKTLWVISCGDMKRATAQPAYWLYKGNFFRAQLTWALAAADSRDDIRILSAKHGLLGLEEVVAPYNLRLGQPGSITSTALRRQLPPGGGRIVTSAGKDYRRLLEVAGAGAWEIEAPFAGERNMGRLMREMRNYARRANGAKKRATAGE